MLQGFEWSIGESIPFTQSSHCSPGALALLVSVDSLRALSLSANAPLGAPLPSFPSTMRMSRADEVSVLTSQPSNWNVWYTQLRKKFVSVLTTVPMKAHENAGLPAPPFYISRLFGFKRNSRIPMVTYPCSSRLGFRLFSTRMIFLNESPV